MLHLPNVCGRLSIASCPACGKERDFQSDPADEDVGGWREQETAIP